MSWAINHGGDQSFSDFVNDLRIADIEKALSSNMNGQSILEIAFNAGFNSKSSFNALFKRRTGLTPSQYVKQKARPGAA